MITGIRHLYNSAEASGSNTFFQILLKFLITHNGQLVVLKVTIQYSVTLIVLFKLFIQLHRCDVMSSHWKSECLVFVDSLQHLVAQRFWFRHAQTQPHALQTSNQPKQSWGRKSINFRGNHSKQRFYLSKVQQFVMPE